MFSSSRPSKSLPIISSCEINISPSHLPSYLERTAFGGTKQQMGSHTRRTGMQVRGIPFSTFMQRSWKAFKSSCLSHTDRGYMVSFLLFHVSSCHGCCLSVPPTPLGSLGLERTNSECSFVHRPSHGHLWFRACRFLSCSCSSMGVSTDRVDAPKPPYRLARNLRRFEWRRRAP